MSSQVRITAPPQIFASSSTGKIMWAVSLCLAPSAAWGVFLFGVPAAVVIAVSVGSALIIELVLAAIAGKHTLTDGSAALTGLLIGMSLPPAVPLYVPIVAVFFALAVVKWSFGGLGNNWMNPALAGRVFVFFCWRDAMEQWSAPSTLPALADGASAATPLATVREGMLSGLRTEGPMAMLDRVGYPRTQLDGAVTDWLNTNIFSLVNLRVPDGYVDLFLGNTSGAIGETSVLLLLIGSIYLLANGITRWEISGSFFFSFAVLTAVFGGVVFGGGVLAGDVLYHLFSGGLVLVMFYFATEGVTAPMTSTGMVVYGVGIGVLAFLLRTFGSHADGSALAVLVMNVFVPIIDRYTSRRRR